MKKRKSRFQKRGRIKKSPSYRKVNLKKIVGGGTMGTDYDIENFPTHEGEESR